MSAAHTPVPWRIAGKGTIRFGTKGTINDGWVADVHWRNRDANAEFIVRAANSHDELVATLREAHLQLVYLDSRFATGTAPAVCARINAALAKAEGRS